MYIIISPFSNAFDDIWILYLVPIYLEKEINIWKIVEIPLKWKIEIWIILEIVNKLNINYDETKIKSIINIKNNNIFLSNYRIKLSKWIANYYFTSINNSINLFLPKNLRDKIGKSKLPNIEKKNSFSYKYNNPNQLSINQENILNKIINSDTNKFLLYWLTWSWKTEIYIRLIKYYINLWFQVLFLIPEIILTNQLSKRIINVFWENVFIINSSVSESTKTKYWIDINNNKAKIIIWTRSALFYPYNNLWLIIIDEEHDNSYISDSSPRYNSIEVANKITELNWNKLLLWSWTPCIKTMYNWINWKYKILNLFEKYI